jgi:hypothetical protein
LAWSGQRKLAFDAGFNDALFGRPNDNPYNQAVVGGSYAAYEEGYELGLISDVPPRGPKGDTGDTGPAGGTGSSGAAGADGSDGNFLYVDAGAPGGGLGNDGDQYIDTDNGDIYTKVTGSWNLQGNINEVAQTTRSDTIDPEIFPEVTYRGDALPGTTEAAALWRVTRFTLQSDGDTEVLYADGNDSFDNIWDNRLSLSYS